MAPTDVESKWQADDDDRGYDWAASRMRETRRQERARRAKVIGTCLVLATLVVMLYFSSHSPAAARSYAGDMTTRNKKHVTSSAERDAALQQCIWKDALAGPPPHFARRTVNDRFVAGTKPTVIRHATVFTGSTVLHDTDVVLDQGLIQSVTPARDAVHVAEAHEVDAQGQWITPGIIDLHTHLGVLGMPSTPTIIDGNSRVGPTRPMVRSVDGINEHDESLWATLSGGITTAMVLPGSLNNIGGQAFPIKLGSLAGRPPSSRVLDAPRSLKMAGEARRDRDSMYPAASGMQRPDGSTPFRQIKMACGENARFYGLVRLDEAWNFRSMFERARRLMEEQDDFCTGLRQGRLDDAAPSALRFPNDLEIDALVDVLRGRSKVHTHCYTMNDLDAFVRHANEFNFSIAAFHHAHETHLVPSALHAAPGAAPAVAMFSTNANYKTESYYGTPFNSVLLQSHNITPIFKSDHPVLDSRRLMNQAAQAHHFGLDELASLRAVTVEPARVLGLDHRIGHIAQGMDADVVLWDRHPLQLGATPTAVYVDGLRQLGAMHASAANVDHKLRPHHAPAKADYDAEIARVRDSAEMISRGIELAFPSASGTLTSAVLHNISRVFVRDGTSIRTRAFDNNEGVLVYADGKVVCLGAEHCWGDVDADVPRVDIQGGVVTPGLVAMGSTLGMSDIPSEPGASDGSDPSMVTEHLRVDKERLLPRAADGLIWGGHDMLRARASGVTTVVAEPQVQGPFGGISAQMDTGARTVLDPHSLRASDVALHLALEHESNEVPAVSTQLALVRAQLDEPSSLPWRRVADGSLPLVVATDSEQIVAQLVLLKRGYPHVHLVLASDATLHRLAPQLAAADIPVLLSPKVWMYGWPQRERLLGPPLTADTELGVLLKNKVRVGLRIKEAWEAANLLWEATWAAQDAHAANSTTILEMLSTKYVGPTYPAWSMRCACRRRPCPTSWPLAYVTSLTDRAFRLTMAPRCWPSAPRPSWSSILSVGCIALPIFHPTLHYVE